MCSLVCRKDASKINVFSDGTRVLNELPTKYKKEKTLFCRRVDGFLFFVVTYNSCKSIHK